jgi:hypothetical protein
VLVLVLVLAAGNLPHRHQIRDQVAVEYLSLSWPSGCQRQGSTAIHHYLIGA